MKLKMSFRPDAHDGIHQDNTALAAITLPDNITTEDTLAEDNIMDPFGIARFQCRQEDITLREEYFEPNLGRPDDDFGDSIFEESGYSNSFHEDFIDAMETDDVRSLMVFMSC